MAIVADLATFKVLFPELANAGDVSIQIYIDDYEDSLNESTWLKCKPKAVLYAAAHEVALSQNRQAAATVSPDGFIGTSSGSGAITSASDGTISASFAQSATTMQGNDSDTYYTLTQYGLTFLALKKQCMALGLLASWR